MRSERPNFPRQAKLRGGSEFGGKFPWRRQGRLILVLARKNPLGGRGRLGMVIGKRSVSRAVDRSSMKRAIREAFRRRRAQLGALDVVIRMRQSAGLKDLPEVRTELDQFFGQMPL
ncbi:MAG: ribonuclease P protein component [Burkholderiales bacterium]